MLLSPLGKQCLSDQELEEVWGLSPNMLGSSKTTFLNVIILFDLLGVRLL